MVHLNSLPLAFRGCDLCQAHWSACTCCSEQSTASTRSRAPAGLGFGASREGPDGSRAGNSTLVAACGWGERVGRVLSGKKGGGTCRES